METITTLWNARAINSPLFFFLNAAGPQAVASKLKSTPITSSSSSLRVSCSGYDSVKSADSEPEDWAYDVLELHPRSSPAQVKAAFRAKVKQCHPDVTRGRENSDVAIKRVIEAYEILSGCSRSEIIERECIDPFDHPECKAYDIFVNGTLCIGKGCPYSCVNTAPHAFKFSSATGAACASSQVDGDDYKVQLAVGQCPRNCIHYVTPSQRIILEELLGSIMNKPYDTSAEADILYSLVVKANYENNRY